EIVDLTADDKVSGGEPQTDGDAHDGRGDKGGDAAGEHHDGDGRGDGHDDEADETKSATDALSGKSGDAKVDKAAKKAAQQAATDRGHVVQFRVSPLATAFPYAAGRSPFLYPM